MARSFNEGTITAVFSDLNEAELLLILQAIDQSRKRLGFLLCGYVLMPDHCHALIWPRFPLTVSRVLQDLKYVSSRKLNQIRKTKGPFWQHQFWDRFVRKTQEFGERLDYMHFNPVRKGLATRSEDWQWSSYNNFSLDKSVVAACPIQIDYIRLPHSNRG